MYYPHKEQVPVKCCKTELTSSWVHSFKSLLLLKAEKICEIHHLELTKRFITTLNPVYIEPFLDWTGLGKDLAIFKTEPNLHTKSSFLNENSWTWFIGEDEKFVGKNHWPAITTIWPVAFVLFRQISGSPRFKIHLNW